MCTLVILRRNQHPWPLLLAGNRDEMESRPWHPPARHWPDQPDIIAGLDVLAGGSWMGINDHGLAAVVMNRLGTLGPQSGKRSRGELIPLALSHENSDMAARTLSRLDPAAYRPFNLVTADHEQALWVRHEGREIDVRRIPEGLHMLTSMELDDTRDPRIRHYLPLFQAARPPDPQRQDWTAWEDLLADSQTGPGDPVTSAMCFRREDGFATLSSSCIALSSRPGRAPSTIWRFAPGAPDQHGFQAVRL